MNAAPGAARALLAAGLLALCALLVGRSVGAEICRLDQFSEGAWRRDESVTQKSHVCCGWDTTDWKDDEIRGECGTQDIGNKDVIQYGRVDFNAQAGGHACVCDELQHQRHVPSEREKWQWRPSADCEVLRWNATRFCELLGHKRIAFLGDSTMVQSAVTVMNMLIAHPPKGTCGAQLMVYHFNTPDHNPDQMMATVRGFDPDHIVVNFGAHFHNDGIFAKAMNEFVDYFTPFVASLPKHVHLVWKTINSPHWNCDPYKAPTPTFPTEPHFTDYYQWELFPIYDNFSNSFFPHHGFEVWNMNMLRLRPDAHPGNMAYQIRGGDCLHFCLPGPLDIFAQMLLHMLHHRHHAIPHRLAARHRRTTNTGNASVPTLVES